MTGERVKKMGKKGEAAVGDETAARIRRWRLILGEESEERFSHSEAGGPALSEEDQICLLYTSPSPRDCS